MTEPAIQPSIQFDGLELVCADVDATVAFYRLLGFDIPDSKLWRTDSGTHHVSNVDLAAGSISCSSRPLANVFHAGYPEAPSPGAIIVGFRVASREAVDDLHGAAVAAGHPSRQEPYDAFWGARYAIVSDPDGRDVGIMSPSDPARRERGPDL